MADTATSGKFSLTHPNTKTYLIVGGVVLVAAGAYFWWKNKQAASAAQAQQNSSGSGGSTVYYPSPTGLSASQLLAWISDHQSAPSTSTTTTTTPGTTTLAQVTVPNVIGMRTVEEAVPAITKAGLVPHIGGGFNSNMVNYVSGESPGPGTKVPSGSTVTLTSTHVKPG